MFDELVASFMSFLESRNFSQNTKRAYKKDVEDFLDFASGIGLKDVREIGFKDIERYIRDMVEDGKGEASVERKLSSIKSFFKFLESRHIVEHNPADLVPFRKRSKKIPPYLSEEEVVSLSQADNERDRVAVLILYGCGLRVSELERLKVKDISGDFVKVHGKGGKWRSVPVPPVVKEEMEHYVKNIRPKYLKEDKEDQGYLFLNRYGTKLSARYIRKVIKRLGFVKTGKDVWPHLLRHSYATHLIRSGADIRVVQELLGHSSINTTQKYVHTNIKEIISLYKSVHPREAGDK